MCKVKQPTNAALTPIIPTKSPNPHSPPKRSAVATDAIISLGKRNFLQFEADFEQSPPQKVQKIVDNQSFISAIRSGHESSFRELLEQIDINQCDPILNNSSLHFAVFYNRVLFVKLLISKGAKLDVINQHGATPLSSAVEKGHTLIAKVLINAGADVSIVDKQGFSILHKAVLTGITEILNFIVKSMDSKLSIDCTSFEQKLTPLHQAAYHGKLSTVKILLAAGANVNTKSNTNTTPLHMASVKNHKKVIEYLIKNNAIVDAQDNHKRTPLHYAAIYGHLDAATSLIEGNAKYDIKDYQDQTALSISIRDGFSEFATLTQNYTPIPSVSYFDDLFFLSAFPFPT